jgi:hypothetical protein
MTMVFNEQIVAFTCITTARKYVGNEHNFVKKISVYRYIKLCPENKALLIRVKKLYTALNLLLCFFSTWNWAKTVFLRMC